MNEYEAHPVTSSELKDLVRFLAGMAALALLFMSLVLLAVGWILTVLSGDYRNAEAVCLALGVTSMIGAFVAAVTRDDSRLETSRRSESA